MPTGITTERLIIRDRIILLSGAVIVLALAWVVLARPGVGGVKAILLPHAHTVKHGGLPLATSLWLVMMVAMMLPPVLPWILFFASATRDHRPSSSPFASASALMGGYFTIWGGFSATAALGQLGLERLALLRPGTLAVRPEVGAMFLLVAGLYQFTALKAACLTHCRSPLGFYLSSWRNGPLGAYRMGFRHGLYCLGCCWALMGLAFAFGIMNLLWMAALTVIICSERLLPRGQELGRAFGFALLSFGAWMIVTGLAA